MFHAFCSCFSGLLSRQAARLPGAAFVLWTGVFGFFISPGQVSCQRTVVFQVGEQTYRAEFFWAIKHAGNEYKSKSAHSIDRTKDDAFDLEATFRFRNDSIPPDNNLVWGFQFRQSGGVIAPATNEKFSRSLRLFQRFQATGTGNGTLTIVPKVWKRNAAGQHEAIAQAAPVTLGFAVTDAAPAIAAPVATTPSPEPAIPPQSDNKPAPTQPTPVLPAAQQAEAQAYNKALLEPDSTLRAKALLNFISQYDVKPGPNSAFVHNALRDVPLGISVPVRKGQGTFVYTLDNALSPVVDTTSLRGWDYTLSTITNGRYELTVRYLEDSQHVIRLADIGKNSPYNSPLELRPFEKIRVELAGETRDSFRIRVAGGVPPFIVYLSQNDVPKIRYLLTRTDTIWSLGKNTCEVCNNGTHTLEVYNSDFSTLLLRAEDSIKIYKVNYFLLALYSVFALLLLYFLYKPALRAWRHFQYERKLRDIESWERKVEEEERRRRNSPNK